MSADLALAIVFGAALSSAASWLLRDTNRFKARTSLYVAHPYRVSGAISLVQWVLPLAVTGFAGAWEPPGVGLPFVLAATTPLCLLFWVGGGFLLKRSMERGWFDTADGVPQKERGLSAPLDRRAPVVIAMFAIVGVGLSVAMLVTVLASDDSDSADIASALEGVAAIDPPEGFHELRPDQMDVGFMDVDRAAMALGGDVSEARQELKERGFVSGWSRHWVRGSIAEDSLVIRSFVFDSPAGAHEFAVPDSCCAANEGPTSTIPNIDDAVVRSSYEPDTEPTGNHLGLPYRVVGIARRCTQVVTVFFRSAEGVHTYEEVNDLLDQVLRTSDSDW